VTNYYVSNSIQRLLVFCVHLSVLDVLGNEFLEGVSYNECNLPTRSCLVSLRYLLLALSDEIEHNSIR
jgi:hypothetical protein